MLDIVCVCMRDGPRRVLRLGLGRRLCRTLMIRLGKGILIGIFYKPLTPLPIYVTHLFTLINQFFHAISIAFMVSRDQDLNPASTS